MIKSLLKNAEHQMGYLEKIFASREGVIAMIEKERADKLHMKTNQTVSYTQLNDKLIEDIAERNIKKTLTEYHVAVSPAVSYA